MEKLRVLLINPPQMLGANSIPCATPPLGLAYVAAMLEQDFEVRIIDCMAEGLASKKMLSSELNLWGLDLEELRLRAPLWEPHVVGISCMFSSQEEAVLSVAALYKEYARLNNKKILTVVGGPHPSAGPKPVLNNKDIDFVVIGEGEIPFYQLCLAVQGGKEPKSINGVGYKDAKDKMHVNDKCQLVKNLDQLPFPARNLLPMDKYTSLDSYYQPQNKPFTNMILTRGCGSQCSFCSVPRNFGRRCRLRSPAKVLEEMEILVRDFQIQEVYFEDDNFFWNLDYAQEICDRLIEANLDLIWSCPAGLVARGYDRKLIAAMKKSGCYSVTLNAESGSDRVLGEIVKSPNDRDVVINLVKDLKKAGLEVKGNFRVGFPGESRTEIEETYKLISRLELSQFRIHTAVPFPGTGLWDKCLKENCFARTFRFKEYLTNEFFINSSNFTVESLPRIMEEHEKNLWKKGQAGQDVIGGLFDKISFGGQKEKKKKK